MWDVAVHNLNQYFIEGGLELTIKACKWWHAPMRHGMDIAFTISYQIYKDQASKTVDPAWILNKPMTSPEFWWFLIPSLGWGIGVVSHYIAVFGLAGPSGEDWEDKELEKEMRKIKRQYIEDYDEHDITVPDDELELKELFPDSRIARMDQDTTKRKHAHAKIIEALELQEIDILVGTQMLAKGLDFRHVSLVGVMNADNLLNFPDFRAHERSFQLLQQVAGRAGRTKKRGKVIIQTYNPYHQILQQVSINSFDEMYKQQMEDRYQFKYPPYYRMIKIVVKERSFQKMDKSSIWLAKALKIKLKENILGPETPAIGRIRNMFITNILIKIPKNQSLPKTKEYVNSIMRNFNSIKEFSSVRVIIDVDNY